MPGRRRATARSRREPSSDRRSWLALRGGSGLIQSVGVRLRFLEATKPDDSALVVAGQIPLRPAPAMTTHEQDRVLADSPHVPVHNDPPPPPAGRRFRFGLRQFSLALSHP